jgi:hypothetical protein
MKASLSCDILGKLIDPSNAWRERAVCQGAKFWLPDLNYYLFDILYSLLLPSSYYCYYNSQASNHRADYTMSDNVVTRNATSSSTSTSAANAKFIQPLTLLDFAQKAKR